MSFSKHIVILTYLFGGLLSPCRLFSQHSQWRLANGTEGVVVRGIDVFNLHPDTVYANGAGIMISTDGGEHWNTITFGPGLAWGPLKVDPEDSRIIYTWFEMPWGGSAYVTRDRGLSWTPITQGGATRIVEIDPSDLNTVYVSGSFNWVVKSSDRGLSWQILPTPPEARTISSLAISPSNHNIIYAGYYTGVFKSTDQGNTWTCIWPANFPYGVELALDPSHADIIYAGIDGYAPPVGPGTVYKSTDGGNTWIEKRNGLTFEGFGVNTIEVNPTNPQELYVGKFSRVGRSLCRTTNGAESWEPYTNGLPDTGGVGPIAFDTLNNRMYACPNRGVYILDSTLTHFGQPIKTYPVAFALRQNYPNPFNSQTIIEFDLPERAAVELAIFSVLGEKIVTIGKQSYEPGSYSIALNATRFSTGVYFYRLTTKNFAQTKRLMIIK